MQQHTIKECVGWLTAYARAGNNEKVELWARALVNALGYDLVKRQTAQEAHDAALARRVAEDAEYVMGR